MKSKLYIDEKHWKVVRQILLQAGIDFYAFGSRVKGSHKKHSDLDLCYKDPLDEGLKFKLEEDFSESDLPFFVDLLDYNSISQDFKDLIDNSLLKLQL